MKMEEIKINDLVYEEDGEIWTNSRIISKFFKMKHSFILKKIKELLFNLREGKEKISSVKTNTDNVKMDEEFFDYLMIGFKTKIIYKKRTDIRNAFYKMECDMKLLKKN